MSSFLLATDLDRTLLPNGPAPDDGGIEVLFHALSTTPHLLVYVTGRNLDMVHGAQRQFGIPAPDYLIADTGTSMFSKRGDALVSEPRWVAYVRTQEPRWNREDVVRAIGTFHELVLQEDWKQNHFKVSYYFADHESKDAVLSHITDALASIAVQADVLWSVDPLKDSTGLIDVLPKSATKATALEFLRMQENLAKNDIVYCGDSGNDILPLTRCYRSILVKNAPGDVKEEVQRRVTENGCPDTLYIATGTSGRNGNYASGILEGLRHFGILAS
ncbi:MAG: hypothetical protein B7X04_03495 [Parcubacteria group bacterium 21-54-25]|nr:MAG: hypothetical protein B7X04_03495 [Parcubacteria group bacterium 21-54-25]HQU08052.1 HAD-IIB family hydrolase [Candidatus Paceibacterota bacterium]